MSFWNFLWKLTVFKWLFGSSDHRDDSSSFSRQSDSYSPPYYGGGSHYHDCGCDYGGVNDYDRNLSYDSFDDELDDFNESGDFDEW